MRTRYAIAGFVCVVGALTAPLVLSALASQGQKPAATSEKPPRAKPQLAQGRYILMVGGCNDCHTPGFAAAYGKTPESDWLTGSTTGYYGPWGTSYPTNLRLLVNGMSEDAWVKSNRELKTLPPMPWWVMHEIREADLRDMYRLIKSLGPKGEDAPAALSPEQKPNPPYMALVPKPAT